MKIIESGVNDIYIALDEDAKEDALKIVRIYDRIW